MNNELRNLINQTKGRFFSITFVKKDGSVRIINGKAGYDRKKKGVGSNATRSLKDQGYVSFVNRNHDSWVCAHTDRVLQFKCGNLVKVFPQVSV